MHGILIEFIVDLISIHYRRMGFFLKALIGALIALLVCAAVIVPVVITQLHKTTKSTATTTTVNPNTITTSLFSVN